MTENEMDGWHHRLNGHEFEQTLGDGEGQGSPGMLQSMASRRDGLSIEFSRQEYWCSLLLPSPGDFPKSG